jgi:hypothetical protein
MFLQSPTAHMVSLVHWLLFVLYRYLHAGLLYIVRGHQSVYRPLTLSHANGHWLLTHAKWFRQSLPLVATASGLSAGLSDHSAHHVLQPVQPGKPACSINVTSVAMLTCWVSFKKFADR